VVAGGDRREVLNAGATVLLLTRKTDYALVALVHLARRAEALVSARELAQRSHLPLPVLMNVLNALAHCGLVRSVRGSRGGYRLARRPEDVTLADVIEAIEGPIGLTMCGSATRGDFEPRCRLEDTCLAREPARRVHRRLREFLSRITLAEMTAGTEPTEVTAEAGDNGHGIPPTRAAVMAGSG